MPSWAIYGNERARGPGPASVVAGYQGPGDIVSGAHFFHGLRAYTAAVAAAEDPLIDITDQSDVNDLTVNCLTDGSLDVATIAAWVTTHSVTTIKIKKLYDQTGSGYHLENADLANRARLVLSAHNGLPGVQFVSASSLRMRKVNGVAAITQPLTFTTAYLPDNSGPLLVMYDGGSGFVSLSEDADGNAELYAGGAEVVERAAAVDTYHSVVALYNTSSSVVSVDGSETSGTLNTNNTGANGAIHWGEEFFGTYFNGYMFEAGAWDAGFDGTQRADMSSNMTAYWNS